MILAHCLRHRVPLTITYQPQSTAAKAWDDGVIVKME